MRRIYFYEVSKFGIVQADKFYDSFFEHFALIAEQPLLFPKSDLFFENTRRCVCGVDSIYFEIMDGFVEIIAIIGRQDILNNL